MDRAQRAESTAETSRDLSAVAEFRPDHPTGFGGYCGAVVLPELSLLRLVRHSLLDKLGSTPGFPELLLEAALGNDLDAGLRQRVVARQRLWVARYRRRLVRERDEKLVGET